MGPGDLEKVLSRLEPSADPRLIVGPDTRDDAAVIEVRGDLALCFTADFITPVVDDPFEWGRVAAANSLSDIYAMGGEPLCAINLVCWSSCLSTEMLSRVLAGGSDALVEAGCIPAGGHTIEDREPKYGLAAAGTIHPQKILRNRGALPGDVLYLTKPLGTGIVATAIKAGLAEPEAARAAVKSMTILNKAAAEAAKAAGARALTDVTGFGLLGHLSEMLDPGLGTGAVLHREALPLLPQAVELAEMGLIPAGAYRNREAYKERTRIGGAVPETIELICFDPQTSGGLLCALPPGAEGAFEAEAEGRGAAAARIGVFDGSGRISLEP